MSSSIILPADAYEQYRQSPIVTDFDESQFPNWDFHKINETFRVSEEIIRTLTPEAVNELYGGSVADQSQIYDIIMEETYGVLYGKQLYNKKAVTTDTFGYLDKLTDSVDETLRCEDLGYFITGVLPDFELATHHMQWVDIYMRVKRHALIAARDHGKSFFYSNAVPAWKMYKFKGKLGKNATERNPRGFLFSFSIQQAIDLLDILKNTIEDNDILRERLFLKDKWNKTDIVCKNKARLTVKGFGSSVRGAHPGWIIVDDPLKDNVIYSKMQREKSINYFHSVIMNMIVPGGPVAVVGTPFHNQDLYGDLKTKKSWKVFEFPAIFPDGTILWPNRWNFEGLMEKKDSQGNLIFAREILCRPITSDSTIFPIEILNHSMYNMGDFCLVHNRESYGKRFDTVVTGCDFAISGSVGADYSVFLTFGIDEMDRMWLMHVYRRKGASYAEQLAMLKHINLEFRPDVMLLEKNQFQEIFVQEAERQGLPVHAHQTDGRKNDLKRGLPGLAIKFERCKYRVPLGDQRSRDFADEMITEFSSVAFTDDKGLQATHGHDDIAMAWWIADEAARMVTTGELGFNYDFA
jgi:hypothetical protein